MKWGRIALFVTLMIVVNHGLSTRRSDAQEPGGVKDPPPQQTPQQWSPEQGIGDQDEGPRGAIPNPKAVAFEIVGRRFSGEDFVRYVRDEIMPELNKKDPKTKKSHWRPDFIVLHNTWKPTLVMRPNGFSQDDLKGLAKYYAQQGWHAGPHLFVDQDGIWVFSFLTDPGVHSPSWNKKSWGVEQLGDFQTEDYNDGAGAKVRDNAITALAILSIALNKDIRTLRFHKDDVLTTHKTCPGKSCQYEQVTREVKNNIEKWKKVWDSKTATSQSGPKP